DALPAETLEAFEHGLDAPRPFVGRAFVGSEFEAELLVFGAHAPFALGLFAGGEIADQVIKNERAVFEHAVGHGPLAWRRSGGRPGRDASFPPCLPRGWRYMGARTVPLKPFPPNRPRRPARGKARKWRRCRP